jgi:acetolactate synthase I/II/III large subunit
MRAYDAVAQILSREGVEYLFSYPSNPIIEGAAQVGIRPIIGRAEKVVLNMADGYTRATNARKPTVVVVQGGPGIENAFGAVAQAHADSIPMLVLPAGPDQHQHGGMFDPIPSYRGVTKWAARINFADRVPEMMHQAFWQIRNGVKGPVLLELPHDVAMGEVVESTLDAYRPTRAHRSAGDDRDVAAVAQLLRSANRPVLIAGHGVLWAEACDELRELAELARVPVATTMAAKGAFPENHCLALGTSAYTISRAAAELVVTSDLIIAVGSGLNGKNHFSASIPHGKTLVQITANPDDIGRDHPVDQAVIGDAKLVLQQLLGELRGWTPPDRGPMLGDIASARQREIAEWLPRLTSDEVPINPYRVVWDLMHTVDRANTILTHDSGNPRDQTLTLFETVSPRGYLGWGKSTQLGTGLGMAMGAKLAHPNKLCINVMGDLAFGTAGMEIETAVRERIPIVTIVLNNSVMGGYAQHMPTASQRYGVSRLSGNYAKVADGLGAHAERVERPDDVVGAITRAIEATRQGQPAVLEMITKEEPVYPVAASLLSEVSKELHAVG